MFFTKDHLQSMYFIDVRENIIYDHRPEKLAKIKLEYCTGVKLILPMWAHLFPIQLKRCAESAFLSVSKCAHQEKVETKQANG